MKLPALLYGTETEVRKRCRTIEKSIADGATLAEALSDPDDVDTHEQSGLIIVEYPGSPLAGQKHFGPYVLPDQIAEGILKERIDRKRERALYDEFLERPFGVLGLLLCRSGIAGLSGISAGSHFSSTRSSANGTCSPRRAPVFGRFRRRQGAPTLSTFLGPALHYRGVPEEQLRAHLLSDGLPPLLPYLEAQMSDFDDSYHLIGDVAAAQDLVTRTGRDGIVLPEQAPCTCVLVDQPEGGIDPKVLSANRGLLIVYRYAEDHGVWIDLYKGDAEIAEFALEWGPDFFDEGLVRGRFDAAAWLKAGLLDMQRAAVLQRLADGMSEGGRPADPNEVARLFGLTRFAGLSCDPSNVKRGPWHLVVERAKERYPDAIVIELGPS